MTYKFTGKGLFYVAAFVCLLTILGAPFAILFIYMAQKAHITIENGVFEYKMLRTRQVPFSFMKKIYIAPHVNVRADVGSSFVRVATVVPLVIEYADPAVPDAKVKKLQFSLNYFERSQEIVSQLESMSGLQIGLPERF